MHSQSETITALAKALCLAQGQMGGAKKTSKNPHLKSNYADLASCWDALREPLTGNGLCVIQTTGRDGDAIIVHTTLLHTSGEWIRGETAITPQQKTPQGIGSAITYGRRYGLAAITGLTQEDDDGHGAMPPRRRSESQPERSPTPPRTEQRRADAGPHDRPKQAQPNPEPTVFVAEHFRAILGDAFAHKLAGQSLASKDVSGSLMPHVEALHYEPDRFSVSQKAALTVAGRAAGARYARDIVDLGVSSDDFTAARDTLGIVGSLKDIQPWDRKKIRDLLRKMIKKKEKAAASDKDEYGAQRYDVEVSP